LVVETARLERRGVNDTFVYAFQFNSALLVVNNCNYLVLYKIISVINSIYSGQELFSKTSVMGVIS
jgi:hypothetical protein